MKFYTRIINEKGGVRGMEFPGKDVEERTCGWKWLVSIKSIKMFRLLVILFIISGISRGHQEKLCGISLRVLVFGLGIGQFQKKSKQELLLRTSHGISFQGYIEEIRACGNSRGQLKKNWNFQRC